MTITFQWTSDHFATSNEDAKIKRSQAEREKQVLELRARAPILGRADQHDTSDLDLFRSANEPRLL